MTGGAGTPGHVPAGDGACEGGYRLERDSLGEIRVPEGAYYGAQTRRAQENFPISGIRLPPAFLHALGMIKEAAAAVNVELGLLDPQLGKAIAHAAREVEEGRHDAEFVLDVFQTGSGTSTNMNANEVISNRAIELLGGRLGSKTPVHPNDHVNLGQSSNDVIPSATHLAACRRIHQALLPTLVHLEAALRDRARAFRDVVKSGRTHLQDATPVMLGQEFGGYATQVAHGRRRLDDAVAGLTELALGGTAVGTGLNAHPEFASRVIARLAARTGIPFREAEDHFEAQGARDAVVQASGTLKTLAVSLGKIANDIRWLASGPRCGLGEIALPATQPGSSIMPGKVNPVMSEALLQAAAQVIGNDLAVTLGGRGGEFELNTSMPLMARNLLESIEILAGAADAFRLRCVAGIVADEARCLELAKLSLMLSTALAPRIGYDRAAALSKEALETGETVEAVALRHGILPPDDLRRILDPRAMTGTQRD
ncbi:MAG: class II fumarate hydratase [Gemmatimonadetes bacterium]|nr:class II fumarate hydratase [Gemmatimonadota bacterium]